MILYHESSLSNLQLIYRMSCEIIDFGVKYSSDVIVDYGLQKFCVAFFDMSNRRDKSHSIYGRATIIKFISLWRLMLTDDLICSFETSRMFHWCFKEVWPQWCDWWGTTTDTATVWNFLSKETSKLFSGEDIYIAAEYFKEIQQNKEIIDLFHVIR